MVNYITESATNSAINENLFAKLADDSFNKDSKGFLRPLKSLAWIEDHTGNEMGLAETLSPGVVFSLAYARVYDQLMQVNDVVIHNDSFVSITMGGICTCPGGVNHNVGVVASTEADVDTDNNPTPTLACYGGTAVYDNTLDSTTFAGNMVRCKTPTITVPMAEYTFDGVVRAKIDVEIETLMVLPGMGHVRECTNEGTQYLTHTKRREEHDYNCNDFATYASLNTASEIDVAKEIKTIFDLSKQFTLKYRFFQYDGAEFPEHGDVKYTCDRVHLNTFILDQDTADPYAAGGAATLAKFPFLCHATECPAFPIIECDDKCPDKQVCIKNMYKGKVTSQYLFRASSSDLDRAISYITDRVQSSLTNHNFSAIKAYSHVANSDGQYDKICWPNWSYQPATVNNERTQYLLDGIQNYQDYDCNQDESLVAGETNRKYCEIWDETYKVCEFCYPGYKLFSSGACYDVTIIDTNDAEY